MGRRPNEGFSMSSFEWMELQTLTNDIELSRSRLVEARKSGDRGRVTALEEEIGRAENRRLQLLAHISTNIVTIPEAAGKGKDGAGARQAQEDSKPAEPAPPARARGGAGSRQAAEPAPPPARAREGAGARQAAAPPAEAVPEEAVREPPPAAAAAAPEPAPPAKAREDAAARAASAPAAEVEPVAVAAQPPPRETASAPEPAPPPKAREEAAARAASAPAAEALPDGATREPSPGETASAPEPPPPPKAREGAGAFSRLGRRRRFGGAGSLAGRWFPGGAVRQGFCRGSGSCAGGGLFARLGRRSRFRSAGGLARRWLRGDRDRHYFCGGSRSRAGGSIFARLGRRSGFRRGGSGGRRWLADGLLRHGFCGRRGGLTRAGALARPGRRGGRFRSLTGAGAASRPGGRGRLGWLAVLLRLTGAGAVFSFAGSFGDRDNVGRDMSEELQAAVFRPADLLLQRGDASPVSALPRLNQTRSRELDVVGKGLQLHPLERTHREALIRTPPHPSRFHTCKGIGSLSGGARYIVYYTTCIIAWRRVGKACISSVAGSAETPARGNRPARSGLISFSTRNQGGTRRCCSHACRRERRSRAAFRGRCTPAASGSRSTSIATS